MASVVIMPKVGISVESCTITRWNKKTGDSVSVGEPLFEYETDKIALEEESKYSGRLLHIFVQEGDEVECLGKVCIIGEEGEDISALLGDTQAESSPAVPADATPVPSEAPAPAVELHEREFVAASPRAKRFAADNNVALSEVTPSGANDRILERDVRAYRNAAVPQGDNAAEQGESAAVCQAAYRDAKMSGIRKAIAKSMLKSVTTIPQVTNTITFDTANISAYRALIKANSDTLGLANITFNDIIVYAAARVLREKEHHALNSNIIGEDVIRTFDDVNIGVAVDTPRGLMVPTIFGADKMSLNEISIATKQLAAQCKEGKISPDMLTGASFTVTNLGSYGIESFTPIVNPPQVAILGVNTIVTRAREKNGELELYKAMGLSLSYDHRAIDGAPASAFLKRMKDVLESFTAQLAK